jgi:hypothetical protein
MIDRLKPLNVNVICLFILFHYESEALFEIEAEPPFVLSFI